VKLLNYQRNEVEDVPEELVGEVVAAGSHGLPKSAPVPVIAPDGSHGTIAPEEAQTAFSEGFRIETQADRDERAKQEQFGEGLAPVQAAVEGVARGATFGLSDLMLTRTGAVSADAMRERKERNPIAATTGEIGSVLLPGLGAVKALGAAGKVAKTASAAPRALSAAAGAIEKGIAGKTLLSRAAAKATAMAVEAEAYNVAHNLSEAALGKQDITAERLLANSGEALALGAGVGFALPLAGRVAQETATRARQAIDRTTTMLRERVLPRVAEAAVKPAAAVSSALSGVPREQIVELLVKPGTVEGAAMREQLLKGITPEARDKVAREFMGAIRESYDETGKAIRQGFNEARPKEIEALLKDVPIANAGAKAEELIANARAAAAAMREQPDVFTQRGLLAKLDQAIAGFEKRLIGDGVASTAELFNLADDFKRTLDKQASKWGKNISPEAVDSVEGVRGVRDMVKGFLEDAEAFGEAAVRQQAFNETFAGYKTAEKEFLRVFGDRIVDARGPRRVLSSVKLDTYMRQVGSGRGEIREAALQNWLTSSKALVEQLETSHAKAGLQGFDRAGLESLIEKGLAARGLAEKQFGDLNRLRALDPLAAGASALAGVNMLPSGTISAVVRTMAGPSALVSALSTAEGLALKTSKRIGSAVDSVIGSATKRAKGLPSPRPVIAPLSVRALDDKAFGPTSTKSAKREREEETRVARFKRRFGEIAAIVRDPAAASGELAAGFEHLSDAAPTLRTELVTKQLAAAQFLYDKAPKNPAAETSMNPLIDEWEPSDAEIAQWERYAAAVQDPLSVIDEMGEGIVSREGVEVLRVVYPNLYNEVVQAFAGRIGELQTKLPYRERLNLSILMDLPVDPSTSPLFVAAMQQAHGQAIQEEEQQQERSLRASANVDLSAGLMTQAQRIANP
jgi:ADP-ribose pyrophosphatase YjhB (NUDIX family)